MIPDSDTGESRMLMGGPHTECLSENECHPPTPALVSYWDFEGGLSSWRPASGVEVDLVLGDTRLAIEAKSSARITRDHLEGLSSLVEDHLRVGRRIVVCREPRARKTDDGIEILPAATFVR